MNNFNEWVKKTTIVPLKIKIVYYGNIGLGVEAVDDIQINEKVLTIPKDYFISLEMVNKFNDFQKKTDLNSIYWNGPKHTAFAAFLLLNRYKNDNSNQWKPYFDMLPDKMFSKRKDNHLA